MKAIVYEKYGAPEVLKIKEIAKPVPKDNEVLIKTFATTVTTADSRLRKADPWIARFFTGLFKPNLILGMDIAGTIEAVGKDVKDYKVGDEVFGSTAPKGGGYAEYKCLPETAVLTIKPDNSSFEEAAAIYFGAHTALHFLRKANVSKYQKVLIYGASGAIGTNAVQLAKYFGAEVTAVCSAVNKELVEMLGADYVFDYTSKDFKLEENYFDVVFDTVGKSPFYECIRALKPKGKYLNAVHMSLSAIFKGLWVSITSSKKVIGGGAHEYKKDVDYLKKLVESGKLKPVIEKVYSMEEIIDAHKHVDSGRKKGNVVVRIV